MVSKNIFIFSLNFTPSSLGDSIRIKSIVEYLNNNSYDVTLYTTTVDAKWLENDLLKVCILNWAIPYNKDRFFIRWFKELILGIELFFKLLFLKNKSYYFFTSPPFVTNFLGLLATYFKKGNLIIDVRDLYPDVYVNQGLILHNSFIHKLLSSFEKANYKRAKYILCATEGLEREIKNRTNKNKVFLLRNGYANFFKTSSIKQDKFTVVFHGSLSKFQNIDLLIEIIKEISTLTQDIKFIIIGSGPKEILFEKLKFDNFSFLGRLSNEETAKIVNKCHLGISLRDDSKISIDSFPVKLYEYIGAGIPSIATPISEGGQILEKLKLGFNLDNNCKRIVDLIIKLHLDTEFYNEIINQNTEYRSKFSRDYFVQELFDKILQ
jgi:glycosyltransferase involved in cell wall biosynthesis